MLQNLGQDFHFFLAQGGEKNFFREKCCEREDIAPVALGVPMIYNRPESSGI
jgi:hypothetical protein